MNRLYNCITAVVALGITLLGIVPTRTLGQPLCPGDCDGDGGVRADEVALVASGIFDPSILSVCSAADSDGTGTLIAAELVAAARAVGECARVSTATPTATLRASPTPSPTSAPVATWIPLAPLAGGARQEVGVAALGETIYVIGGFGGPARVEAYDIPTNAWRSVADLPAGRNHIGAAALAGRIYVVGGFDGAGFAPVRDVYRYDPLADRWEDVEPLPTARGALAVAELGGKLYAIGGDTRLGSVTRHDAYDPLANAWTALAPLPSPRNHLAAAALDGFVYALGGRSPNVAELDRYDPQQNTWRVLAPMPTARSGHAVAAVHGRLVAFGGEVNTAHPQGVFPQVELYDPASNTWMSLAPMPVPRHGIGAVTVNDLVYVPGGATSAGFGATDHNDALRISFE